MAALDFMAAKARREREIASAWERGFLEARRHFIGEMDQLHPTHELWVWGILGAMVGFGLSKLV